MLSITERLHIPLREFDFTFVRSSGAGGQNVNKVNSKALLSWAVVESPSLPEDIKRRFMEKFGSRLNQEGILHIQSDRFRDQPRNVQDCLNKLRIMLLQVAIPPKKRKKTKPPLAAKRRRLEKKRRHGEKKRQRREWDE